MKEAEQLADDIRDTIKDALEYGSPSKVMRRIGLSIAEGLAVGMHEGSGLVDRSAAALGMIPMAQSFAGASGGGGDVGGGGQNTSITLNFPGVDPRDRGQVETVTRQMIFELERAGLA